MTGEREEGGGGGTAIGSVEKIKRERESPLAPERRGG